MPSPRRIDAIMTATPPSSTNLKPFWSTRSSDTHRQPPQRPRGDAVVRAVLDASEVVATSHSFDHLTVRLGACICWHYLQATDKADFKSAVRQAGHLLQRKSLPTHNFRRLIQTSSTRSIRAGDVACPQFLPEMRDEHLIDELLCAGGSQPRESQLLRRRHAYLLLPITESARKSVEQFGA